MKKRRNSTTKIYYIMAIICLVILFLGYGTVYKLSELRKENSEMTTISLEEQGESIIKRYDRLFAKIMSYFNIFFKETFKEYDENGMFDNNYYIGKLNSGLTSVESGEKTNLDNIEIYPNDEYDNEELYKKTVLLANNRKEDFFVILEGFEIASRMLNSRDLKSNAEKINNSMNIIIYHTHATESYSEAEENNYRSENVSENVVSIGKIISTNLNNFGLNVTHLKDYNDIPSYNKSYANSKELVLKELDDTKNNLIIDIHRDGADAESNYEKVLESVTRVKINDKYIATFSLVIGGNNENIEELKEVAEIVKSISDELYPGLCRGILVRDGAIFNQNISDYALLIEVGSHLNTIEEAKLTSDYLSEILYNAIIKINN